MVTRERSRATDLPQAVQYRAISVMQAMLIDYWTLFQVRAILSGRKSLVSAFQMFGIQTAV